MTRLALLLLLLLPAAALAQAPRVSVALDPQGPVTVGMPVTVTATVLVPTWMPEPPAWPDLQIADAITRLPERATHPVTEKDGAETWSGLARSWEIIPQRAGDYDLGQPELGVTFADPETSKPASATLKLPPVTFSATLPAGAEGIDPFLAAAALTLTATIDGLPQAPKPGDAFTLTLTTTASGPPAILLPPLAGRIATPPGLRVYPRQPVLADGTPATRTEAVAYVVEAPGSYAFPAVVLDWWNTDTARRERAATEPLTVTVAVPPGWRPAGARPAPWGRTLAVGLGVAALLALLAGLRRWRSRPPSEARLFRRVRRAIRREPVAVVRARLSAWRAAWQGAGGAPFSEAAEAALRALDRQAYGPAGSAASPEARRDLLAAVEAMRRGGPRAPAAALRGLNEVRAVERVA